MLATIIIIYTLAVILVILYETSHYREYEQDTDWKRVTVLSLLWPALSVWGLYGRIRAEMAMVRHYRAVTSEEAHDDTEWTTTGDDPDGKYTVMDIIDGAVPDEADADVTWDFHEMVKFDDDSIAERLYRLERDRARLRSRALHPSNQPDDLFSDDQGGFYWGTDDEGQ